MRGLAVDEPDDDDAREMLEALERQRYLFEAMHRESPATD
jgi:hypothetical protein